MTVYFYSQDTGAFIQLRNPERENQARSVESQVQNRSAGNQLLVYDPSTPISYSYVLSFQELSSVEKRNLEGFFKTEAKKGQHQVLYLNHHGETFQVRFVEDEINFQEQLDEERNLRGAWKVDFALEGHLSSCVFHCEVHACETGGETACYAACETSACETACQYGCEIDCLVGCETACQTACEVLCELTCESACQSGCETVCVYECQTACESSVE